ncbi:TonB-dependent receptor [bacterium]|nr:TonB-dependent receptor [bacterium]MCI0603532.1 TonB-dependent receptor [bacterium]
MRQATHSYTIKSFAFLFAILLLALAVPAQAQEGTLNGDVKDSDGLPLPGVIVTAAGGGVTKNAYTDAEGRFVIGGLAAGNYDVSAELSGFVTITQMDVAVSAGDNNVSFVMRPGGLTELMVVTASKVETPLINAPATMSVVTSETIESTPAQNYADLLRSVPGLNVVQTSARDINMTSRQASSTLATSQLALLDGRSIYLDFFGFIAWDFLPVNFSEIKQIEVIRGPASAVWGANAQTGVVNIITKTPRETPGFQILVSGGAFDRDVDDGEQLDTGTSFGTNVRFAQAVDDTWSYKISAGYFTQDALARPAGTVPVCLPNIEQDGCPGISSQTGGAPYARVAYENRGTSQPKIDFRLDQEVDEETRLSYSAGYAGTEGIVHTGIGPFDIDSGSFVFYGKVNYSLGDFKLNFFTNILDADSANLLTRGANGQFLSFTFKTQTYDIETAHSMLIRDKHILSFGGNYRRNNFELELAQEAEDRNEVGGYIQDEFFTDKFRLVLGARVDKFSVIEDPVFSPRITFMFKPSPSQAIRASFNRAFRSPSAINNFLDTAIIFAAVDLRPFGIPVPVFPIIVPAFGNPDLKEESLTAYEIGYTGEFGGRTSVSASFYINDSDDNINFVPTGVYSSANLPPLWAANGLPAFLFDIVSASQGGPFPSGFTYLNIGPLRQHGFELGVDSIVTDNVSVFANYSWQGDPKILDPDSDQLRYPDSELIFPPKHRFNAGMNYNSGRYLASAALNYTSEAFWTDVLSSVFHGPTEAFTTVSGSFGVRWLDGRITTALKVNNIFDDRVQQHIFGDIIQRSWFAEVMFNF